MPLLDTLTVPDSRRIWYTINFPWLQTGETFLTLVTNVVADAGAADEGTPLFTVTDSDTYDSEKKVQILAGGGLDGGHYLVYVAITTSLGQEAEEVLEFYIDNGGL